MPTRTSKPTRTARRTLPLICLAIFGGYAGQQFLTPVLPPIARELDLTELQFGIVMSASAAMAVLVGPWWGRRSDTHGRKPLIVLSLLGSTAGLLAFAVSAHLGLSGAIGSVAAFTLFLLTRGVLFGGTLAALPVAAQSYVADVTPDEQDRVKGLARVGAALGLALVLGPGLGGLLAELGLVAALYWAPVLIVLPGLAVWALLPPDPRPERGTAPPPRLSPRDPRVWPFLLAGVGLYLSISLLSMSLGFLLQDRLALSTGETAEWSGYVLLAGGLPMLLVQALVIPYLDWRPLRLLRVGVPVVCAAFAAMIWADTLPAVFAATTLSGVGHSFAVPGYTSALSLRVSPDEQGGAAGLITATNGLTLVIGPLAATSLYQAGPSLPFACGAVALGLLAAFLWLSPRVREGEGRGAGSGSGPNSAKSRAVAGG